MLTIRVPGTTANLGPGFDSCGLALDLYLTLEVGEEQSEWHIDHHLGEKIPKDKENLIIQTALSLAPNLVPRKLMMQSDIPSARGLGSSSAAIVAGIELANQLEELELTPMEKVNVAAAIEGHPDNVAPAILGDFVVASQLDKEVYAVKHAFPETGILAIVPKNELLTTQSREVLPKTMTYPKAIEASAISNVMISAILTGNISLAGKMMEKDLWHETYREKLIPQLRMIRQWANENGAYGTFLSGAGPTVVVLVPKAKLNEVKNGLSIQLTDMLIKEVNVSSLGIQLKK